MKISGIAVGLAAMLATGSASATVVYDTITGQTPIHSNFITLASGLHAPLGADFTAANPETISSVTLDLVDQSVIGTVSDAGSVLVFLVQGTGSPSLPSASGLKLTNPIYLGTILDSSLTGGGIGANVSNFITLPTDVSIGAGTWWIELTSSSDKNNNIGTPNSVASTAKWAEIASTATGTIGVPSSGNYTSGSNSAGTGIIGGVDNDSTSGSPSPNDELFMMTIGVPEPASVALLGTGLLGLGLRRFRRSNKKTGA